MGALFFAMERSHAETLSDVSERKWEELIRDRMDHHETFRHGWKEVDAQKKPRGRRYWWQGAEELNKDLSGMTDLQDELNARFLGRSELLEERTGPFLPVLLQVLGLGGLPAQTGTFARSFRQTRSDRIFISQAPLPTLKDVLGMVVAANQLGSSDAAPRAEDGRKDHHYAHALLTMIVSWLKERPGSVQELKSENGRLDGRWVLRGQPAGAKAGAAVVPGQGGADGGAAAILEGGGAAAARGDAVHPVAVDPFHEVDDPGVPTFVQEAAQNAGFLQKLIKNFRPTALMSAPYINMGAGAQQAEEGTSAAGPPPATATSGRVQRGRALFSCARRLCGKRAAPAKMRSRLEFQDDGLLKERAVSFVPTPAACQDDRRGILETGAGETGEAATQRAKLRREAAKTCRICQFEFEDETALVATAYAQCSGKRGYGCETMHSFCTECLSSWIQQDDALTKVEY